MKQKEEQRIMTKKEWESQKEVFSSLEEQKKKKEEEYHQLSKKFSEEQTAYYASESQISQFTESLQKILKINCKSSLSLRQKRF